MQNVIPAFANLPARVRTQAWATAGRQNLKLKAVIFDMDGVLVDSEYWWQKWETKFFKYLFGEWNESDWMNIIGRSLKDIYRVLEDNYNLTMSWTDFQYAYNQTASDIYQKQCQLMPDAYEVLDFLTKNSVKLALASSSFHSWIKMTVDRFKLGMYFDVVVSAEDVKGHGKPAPDIYLYTARKLKVKPNKCLVVEDSSNGILAAKAAGIFAIGYQTKFNRLQDLRGADEIVKNLGEIEKFI